MAFQWMRFLVGKAIESRTCIFTMTCFNLSKPTNQFGKVNIYSNNCTARNDYWDWNCNSSGFRGHSAFVRLRAEFSLIWEGGKFLADPQSDWPLERPDVEVSGRSLIRETICGQIRTLILYRASGLHWVDIAHNYTSSNCDSFEAVRVDFDATSMPRKAS